MKPPHFLYLEEVVNGEWIPTGRIYCRCHIDENHWKERP
jgi:hypothetical protein